MFPVSPIISEESKAFIRNCLQIDEKKRFSLSDIANCELILKENLERKNTE